MLDLKPPSLGRFFHFGNREQENNLLFSCEGLAERIAGKLC
nr:hypothetical protein [Providencia rettgeri]